MKTKIMATLIVLLLLYPLGWAIANENNHTKFIYPVVRITYGYGGGSGTVIYSGQGEDSSYSTYILTNNHVVKQAVSITEEWDSNLRKEIKKEKRDIVYVEFFEYKDLSVPIGTLKIEADIIIYDADQDLALIKTRSEKKAEYVAKMYPAKEQDKIHVFDKTVAVGCSLGFPPIPTPGIITRMGFKYESYEYWMSSSQIIYGNSGGAMFLNNTGELIGIPSLVPVIGWGTPITHMGLFIPIQRIQEWLEKEHFDFIWDNTKTEKECLELREKELEEKRNKED